ncbi:MazG family protein [Actinotalea sp. K2]|uniref:MazG family protein n=1 Tax=Actinotalea sp. K2 TaxID=2939438 RepID=UPI002016C06A|nr:MazG family protein [Actinotalea sp. K2]
MDRLRSPGGCPWDARQTHASLVPYAIEEVHEVVEAIEKDDRAGLREELGDLLLQVVFHARLAQEHPTDPFGLDEVAAGIAAKLRRRHPHVFEEDAHLAEGGDEPGEEDLHRRWEQLKQAEKARVSTLDGIPAGLPALARAQKVLGRARRAGVEVDPQVDAGGSGDLGERLLALVVQADASGVDAEGALRAAVRSVEAAVRSREAAGRAPHADDGSLGPSAAPAVGPVAD